jgi:LAS superfamily LD-carboxypeptidase LdcB
VKKNIHTGGCRLPLIYLFIICLLITIAGHSLANAPVKILKNTGSTKIFRMITEDFVSIDGKYYKIPAPWKGNKLKAQQFVLEDFALIPIESSYQQSKLYLIKEAQKALVEMIEKAKQDGVILIVHSAYRSKGYQLNIFMKMMEEGRGFADIIRYVAPPGYSEHMLGTVVDFYPSNWSFADGDSYRWLQKNGAEFGFSESYPQISKNGEPWEPWHWRYISDDITSTLKNTKDQ